MRPLRIAPVSCVILSAVFAVGPSRAQEVQPVTVTNFPEVQTISGRVVVSEPIPQSRFETVKALVSPAGLAETNQWTEAGVLETQGFSHVTLSLAGYLQGTPQSGAIGVALVPDVPEMLNALRTYGIPQAVLRVEAEAGPSLSGFFSSASTALRVGFPRYRVFLYNATSKSADAVVYAYLSGS
ncbi:MAG TPA: hypothetical protein VMW27_16545 [Thermoanaerobaculia bacterium]|nr:hypothetical protein [Thermoanaerobaculia bacterium]